MIDISYKNKTGAKPEILSAVIGADSFFYGLSTKNNELLEAQYFEVANFDDPEILNKIKSAIITSEGLDVKVCYTGKPYIHSHKDDGSSLTKYFPAFQNKDEGFDIFTDQEVIVDYGMSKSQATFLTSLFGDIYKSFHVSTVLANYYYPYSVGKIIALIDMNKIHLMYASNQKFLYYNQFDCVHENDYLYFTMLAYKELGLDPQTVALEISGKIDGENPIYTLLHGYVKNTDLQHSSLLDIKDLKFRSQQHFYLELFATAICA